VNGTLYFQANDGTTGVELWKSDGTSAGTVLVRDIRSGGNSSSATNLTNVNGTLYFRANDGATGDELWKAISSSNTAPTSLTLSASSIAENQASGTSVGTFSTTDPDAGDTFTYTLVSGTGSTDNASFTIDGSTLKTAASFDFETKSSYSIRVRTTDQGGLSYEKQFTITVLDVNEAATQITLSNVVSVLLANANTSSAIRLADVSITDDGLGTNTFNVSGADASVFEVVAGQLRLKAGTVLNYTTQKTYSVTVNVDDTTVGGTPDASVNYTLSLQPLEGTTVQNGSVGRSYVRYVSLNFVVTQGLAEAVASVGTATPRIRLFFGGTSGTQAVAKTLTAGMVSLVGSQVKVDFGTQGVGGNAGTSLGDGIYRLRVDLDGDGLAEITGTFFRLFGDVDGNGLVNDTDISLVTAAQGTSGLNLATDLNGDGFVNATDLTNVKRRKGARVTL
jgi:ELWxxDGT repeat protein